MKNTDLKKVAIVGTGFVGMSFAYALMNSGECDQLVLIDINKTKAHGEAMDMNHGLAFAKRNMYIQSQIVTRGIGKYLIVFIFEYKRLERSGQPHSGQGCYDTHVTPKYTLSRFLAFRR